MSKRVIVADTKREESLFAYKQTLLSAIGFDAEPGLAFLVNQMAYSEAEAYAVEYQPRLYQRLVPVVSLGGEGITGIEYRITDRVGRGKRIATKGDDVPMADVGSGLKLMPVHLGAIGYEWSNEQLRRAARLQIPLGSEKQSAAIEGYYDHLNAVALSGEDGVEGLYNSTLIPQANATNGDWLDAGTTNQEILADINEALMAVYQGTLTNYWPNTLVLPTEVMARFTQPVSTIGELSLLAYVKANNIATLNGGVDLQIIFATDLAEAGVGATGRMIAYNNSDRNLRMHVPMPIRFGAPQQINLHVQVLGEYTYSGLEIRRPKAAVYRDNIITP